VQIQDQVTPRLFKYWQCPTLKGVGSTPLRYSLAGTNEMKYIYLVRTLRGDWLVASGHTMGRA
jgi:hypothetical protein